MPTTHKTKSFGSFKKVQHEVFISHKYLQDQYAYVFSHWYQKALWMVNKSKFLIANNVNNKPNHDVLSVFSFYFLCRELCLVLFCIHCIEVFFHTWFLNLQNQNLLQKGLKKIYHRIDIYGSRTIAPKENCPPLRIITSRITSPWIIAPWQLPPWKISHWKTTPSS